MARRNALFLRHESFRSDADRLLAALGPILRPAAATQPEPEPTETASAAERVGPVSARRDTGWSSTQIRVLQHPSKWGLLGSKKVNALAFSPDGRWLAAGTGGNRAVLWMLTPPSDR